MTVPRVDAHMHLFAPLDGRYARGLHDLYPAERAALVEDYLQVMDVHGIDHSVIVSLDEHDDYTRHVVAEFPERFSAISVMDTRHPDPVEDFRSRIAAMPIVGYRIWELGDVEAPVTQLRYFGLLEEMSRCGVAAWFYSSPEQLALLPRVLDALPDLTVVLNHLGFCQSGFLADEWGRPRVPVEIPPPSLPLVESLARYAQVSVHFSGHYAFSEDPYPYEDLRPVSEALLNAFGSDRLLWASDWPWVVEHPGYAAVIDMVDQHLPGLTAHERAQVLGGNAARILGIGAH
jgi:predicted TIM-barrel fold metal-dependent hydrolase